MRRLRMQMIALPKHGGDATISPMLDRHRTRVSRIIGTVLACVFAIVYVTSSICPACLSQDLPSSQQTAVQNTNHHHGTQDCDRDGCSCCGFQFVATAHREILDAREPSAAAAPLTALAPIDYPSDFYHPPRV